MAIKKKGFPTCFISNVHAPSSAAISIREQQQKKLKAIVSLDQSDIDTHTPQLYDMIVLQINLIPLASPFSIVT